MIKNWTLENFKSVSDRITLDFAPLTVFAGPNNSGKSTIIQSILLLAQTMQSSVQSRSVILNGPILQLGEFDDVVYNSRQGVKILIGFEVTPIFGIFGYPSSFIRSRGSYYYAYASRRDQNIASINCDFSFSASGLKKDKELFQLQPRLEHFKLSIEPMEKFEEKTEEFHVKRITKAIQNRIYQYNLNGVILSDPELKSLEYRIIQPTKKLDKEYRRLKITKVRRAGVSFAHFLPRFVSVVFDEVSAMAEYIINVFDMEHPIITRRHLILDNDETILNEEFKNEILNDFGEIMNKADLSKPRTQKAVEVLNSLNDEFTISKLIDFLGYLYATERRQLRSVIKEKELDLFRMLTDNQPTRNNIELKPLSRITDTAVNNIEQFFTQTVKYLGPLRDEPKPIYSLASAPDSRDIGIRGENTAAVLDVHRNLEIEYIPSSQFALVNPTPEIMTTNLLDAVLDWLVYLGVATDVKTYDKGKIGHELKVTTKDSVHLHDLIHVGVGVSQILPIVVLALIAEKDSFLIFEQPELHLHPKVQTRLADFFLSMTMLQKQCIVETHSEYLINRLRYRAATAEEEDISEKIMIYFVEMIDGQSKYNQIKINKYGVIENWPEGFFDESEVNAAKILKAGMEKRKFTRKND